MTKKEFLVLNDQFTHSHLSLDKFCAEQTMSKAKFYYWRRKYSTQLFSAVETAPQDFAPISMTVPISKQPWQGIPMESQNCAPVITINLPNGSEINLRGNIDSQLILEILSL